MFKERLIETFRLYFVYESSKQFTFPIKLVYLYVNFIFLSFISDISTHSNNSSTMPSSEFSIDSYCFHCFNDHDSIMNGRQRNAAKIGPYLINTNMVRPLYQSLSSQAITTTAPLKSRSTLNSMGNTLTNSSTSSSIVSLGGTIRHPNIHQSDFLVPNPSYSTSFPAKTQPLSNSSSYATPPSTSMLLSESLSQEISHRLSNTNHISLSNEHHTNLMTSKNNSPIKYPLHVRIDLHSGKVELI